MITKIIKVSDFTDKYITCVDCHDEFCWSKGEQAYFFSKGLAEPRRCKPCRNCRRVSIVIDDRVGDNDGS